MRTRTPEQEHAYYLKHRDRIKAKNAAYQKAHPEKRAVYSKRWREANKPQWAAYCKTPRVRLAAYRKSADRRGIRWELPEALAFDLMTDVCFYCHAAPSPINGIDRVDSCGAYEYGNVVSACWDCNRMKGAMTRDQFESRAARIAEVARA